MIPICKFMCSLNIVILIFSSCCTSLDHTELPVCSICLERMDESISTVLTILCNHSFHGNCLAQWEDETCPVCR